MADKSMPDSGTTANAIPLNLHQHEELCRKLDHLHVLLAFPSLVHGFGEMQREEQASYFALAADVAAECQGMAEQLRSAQ